MNKKQRLKVQKQLQVEVDTSFLYRSIATIQSDPMMGKILHAMADIEAGHAKKMLEKMNGFDPTAQLPKPSLRAKIQLKVGALFGYGFILNNLATIEQQLAQNGLQVKLAQGEVPTGYEHNHLQILDALKKNSALNTSGGLLSKLEKRHRSIGGNALRAAVLGANDGLVSNMSLVMGVIGAAATNNMILVTGLAGLLAGSISMALGEWLSVQSSRELHLRQIELESEEIASSPEDEKKELVLLYEAKGMTNSAAIELAEKAFINPESALKTLITEELGIDPEELGGSAWEAAFASFFLFATGAIIPVLPYFLFSGSTALYWSLGSSVVGLFGIGAATTLFTGRSVLFAGSRQVVFGLIAAAITYGVGYLIGVSLGG